ncbi:hypothetical protein DCAR_0934315 [Daucus carota subsp. sativus]|uniref:Uncharacterized protein n=1 Tax=Daucus carota subsp. sativus TaxID=79200 RepID=A0AAF0XWQ4_DAUCS|nr:hypothetical protein DCAR_0934315 [Daucus carota subsp. sativus]
MIDCRGSVDDDERLKLGLKRPKMKDLHSVFTSQKRKKGAACTALDLNATVDLTKDRTPACAYNNNNLTSSSNIKIDKLKGFGFDLNVEDVSSSADYDLVCPNKHIKQLKLRDDSECESTCNPVEDKDPMKVWKEMKQNGFMSSSHGGIPIPKPRGRKSKADGLKKKMEIARREQVDRFAKIAAPSGLLNGLNPGIINHVRNSKQVHSIIEALVRSERRHNFHTGNNKEKIQMKTERIESSDNRRNLNLSGIEGYNLCQEDCLLNNALTIRQTTANVASQWLDLLQHDINGRLGALRRSKKRVRSVIQTELPLLISGEFSHNQENDTYVRKIPFSTSSVNATANMHKAKWNVLFNQMENALLSEERQLENWLNQVKEMQTQCGCGLSQLTGKPGMQQLGIPGTEYRIENSEDLEGVVAVMAAAAAFYSTCNFSVENLPCF